MSNATWGNLAWQNFQRRAILNLADCPNTRLCWFPCICLSNVADSRQEGLSSLTACPCASPKGWSRNHGLICHGVIMLRIERMTNHDKPKLERRLGSLHLLAYTPKASQNSCLESPITGTRQNDGERKACALHAENVFAAHRAVAAVLFPS